MKPERKAENILIKRGNRYGSDEPEHTVMIRYSSRKELDAGINFLLGERSLFPASSDRETSVLLKKLPVIR